MFFKMPAFEYCRQISYKKSSDVYTSNYTNLKIYIRIQYLLQNIILKFKDFMQIKLHL